MRILGTVAAAAAAIGVVSGVVSGVGPAAWPVEPTAIVRGFDPPEAAWLAGHRGLDLAAGPDSTVRAVLAGTVTFADEVAGKPVVVVTHASGLRSTYEPVLATVAQGARVLTGQPIGRLAAHGGHCGGLAGCLHLGLRLGEAYLDPLRLLRPQPVVLKPAAAPRRTPPWGAPARTSP